MISVQDLLAVPDVENHGLQIFVKRIGPATASAFLSSLGKNRKPKERITARYDREMAMGEWQLNGEALVFDKNGQLRQGQHRLLACVRSDVAFDAVIVWGVEPDVFRSMDSGARRTLGDVFSIENEKNYNTLAGAVQWMWRYQNGRCSSGDRCSNAEGMEILQKHFGLRDWASTNRTDCLLSPSIATFVRYMADRVDSVLATRFFEALADGAELQRDEPVYLLRKRLIDNRAAKAKLPPYEILALVIKAWNATRKGLRLRVLMYSSREVFPEFGDWKEGDSEDLFGLEMPEEGGGTD